MPSRPLPSRRPDDSSKRLRCVIVEDHQMFRELLGAMLEADDLLEVAAVAGSAREGIEACKRHQPDILLLDLALPDRNGLAVVRALAKDHPSSRTIIVSGEADTWICPPNLKTHIYSVVDKTRAFAVLKTEIINLVRQLTGKRTAAQDDTRGLTPRELEIYHLLGQGLTSKEIAERIFTSRHTVDTHRRNIAAKMGVGSSALVQRAAYHNLLSKTAQTVH